MGFIELCKRSSALQYSKASILLDCPFNTVVSSAGYAVSNALCCAAGCVSPSFKAA